MSVSYNNDPERLATSYLYPLWYRAACILGFIAVGTGAFGSHVTRHTLTYMYTQCNDVNYIYIELIILD